MITLRIEADPRGPVCRMAAAHGGQKRKDALERGPLAACEDGDVAGPGPMAPAGHRAVDRLASERGHLLPEPANLGLVGRRHLHPDLSRAIAESRPSSASSTAADAGGSGETGDDGVAGLHHPRGALAPVRARVQEPPRGVAVQIPYRHVESVAQQRARELAPTLPSPMKPMFMSMPSAHPGSSPDTGDVTDRFARL